MLLKKNDGNTYEVNYNNLYVNALIVSMKQLLKTMHSEEIPLLPNSHSHEYINRLKDNYRDFDLPIAFYNTTLDVVDPAHNTVRLNEGLVNEIIGQLNTSDMISNDITNVDFPYIETSVINLTGSVQLNLFTETYRELLMFKSTLMRTFKSNVKWKITQHVDVLDLISDEDPLYELIQQMEATIRLPINIYIELDSIEHPDKNDVPEKPNTVESVITFSYDMNIIDLIRVSPAILYLNYSVTVDEGLN